MHPRTPTEFTEEFEPIREELNKLEPESLVIFLIHRLNQLYNSPDMIFKGGWMPWDMLFVIKLAFAYNSKATKVATEQDVINLLNKVRELSTPASRILASSMQGKVNKYARITAFQQFWLQPFETMSYLDISRHYFLFESQFPNFDFTSNFERTFGMSFIKFSKILLLVCIGAEEGIPSELPSGDLTLAEVKSFFSVVSDDFENFQKKCAESFNKNGLQLQVTERSLFKTKPYFRRGDTLLCIFPRLLRYYLKHGVYDIMKSTYGNDFSNSFGKVLEQYIELRLIKSGVPFINEMEIKKHIPDNKSADFVLTFSKFNIIIESKGIEMGASAMVDPNPTVLENELRGKITKALEQTIFTDKILKTDVFPQVKAKKSYLFIVSYKQLFLGNGVSAWGEVFEKTTMDFRLKNEIATIQPERIHFVEIDELERFLLLVQSKTEEEVELFLDEIASKNMVPATSHLTLGQDLHLKDGFEKYDVHFTDKFRSVMGSLKQHWPKE